MTQQQKILTLMCQSPHKWFYPYEFMKPTLDELYVGYKAPVRIAEMHKKYPLLFERKTEDKYMQRRINMARYSEWYWDLDRSLQRICLNLLGSPPVESKQPAGHAISWLNQENDND